MFSAMRVGAILAVAVLAVAAYNPVPDPHAVVVSGGARFTVLTSQLLRMECGKMGWTDFASLAIVNRLLDVPSFQQREEQGWLHIETDHLLLSFLVGSCAESLDEIAPGFTPTTLSVAIKRFPTATKSLVWHPGDPNPGQLHGTVRTLDGVDGSIELDCAKQTRADLHCTEGVISRTGWVLVDDSLRLLFSNDTWPWFQQRVASEARRPGSSPVLDHDPSPGGRTVREEGRIRVQTSEELGVMHSRSHGTNSSIQDWYFFGHGYDYVNALFDFSKVAGSIPLPPRHALGGFYSRYWAYSDNDLKDIIEEYVSHRVPLDNLVTDMDWHITFYKEADRGAKDQAGQSLGWTGFTWDSHLFSDPSLGLHNTLNLHPASGTQPWEEQYVAMAQACGIDPSTKKYVAFDLRNRTYVETFFKIMVKPRENEGINFWWLDWQQGEQWEDMPINPTFWLNYIFFTNKERWGNGDRPLLLHRWGGLGNHRYQCGFSGDVHPSWASLAFQVLFTHTAANVGFGFWSHDIGGHTAPTEPELYTRWVQWGSFSPMFRPHSTKQPDNHRELWLYPTENFVVMRSFVNWRARMIPYIYSAAGILAHNYGVSVVHPMYYFWPSLDAAYDYTQQYLFGSDVMVAPVTVQMDAVTQLAATDVWVPEGCWIEWLSGNRLTPGRGGQVVHRASTLYEMPLYVKCGAIIPMLQDDQRPLLGSAQWQPDALTLDVFPPAVYNVSVSSMVYEDSGDSSDYDENHAQTGLSQMIEMHPDGELVWTANIAPVLGEYSGMPQHRAYELVFRYVLPPTEVSVDGVSAAMRYENGFIPTENWIDDLKIDRKNAPSWEYDGYRLATVVSVGAIDVKQGATVKIRAPVPPHDDLLFGGKVGKWQRLKHLKVLLDNQWDAGNFSIDKLARAYPEDYPSLLEATEVGVKVSQPGADVVALLQQFDSLYSSAVLEIDNIKECPEIIIENHQACLLGAIKKLVLAQLQ